MVTMKETRRKEMKTHPTGTMVTMKETRRKEMKTALERDVRCSCDDWQLFTVQSKYLM